MQLASEEFEKTWGALNEFINTKKRIARFYNLIFIARRIIFIVLCLFTNENGGLVLVINILIDLIYGIYMGYA
jgi:hypothetical protein